MNGQGDDEDKESAFKEHASPAVEVNGIKIPQTFKQAINDKDHGKRWQEAVEEEINQLVKNGTWEKFILPDGANLVDTKRVFTIKLNTDGSLQRYNNNNNNNRFLRRCGHTTMRYFYDTGLGRIKTSQVTRISLFQSR